MSQTQSAVRKSSYGQSNHSYSKPAAAKQATRGATGGGAGEAKDPTKATTHYMKNSAKEFVNDVAIWENDGEHGQYIKLVVKAPLAEGVYFVSKKRDKSE